MSEKSQDEVQLMREKRMASQSQSKLNLTSEKLGQIPTDFELNEINEKDTQHLISFFLVLDRAWRSPFKLKSNFARQASIYVATSASLGYITNQTDHDRFGQFWTISPMGIDFLGELDEILEDIAEQLEADPAD